MFDMFSSSKLFHNMTVQRSAPPFKKACWATFKKWATQPVAPAHQFTKVSLTWLGELGIIIFAHLVPIFANVV